MGQPPVADSSANGTAEDLSQWVAQPVGDRPEADGPPPAMAGADGSTRRRFGPVQALLFLLLLAALGVVAGVATQLDPPNADGEVAGVDAGPDPEQSAGSDLGQGSDDTDGSAISTDVGAVDSAPTTTEPEREPIVADAMDRPPPSVLLTAPPEPFETDLIGPPGDKPWAVFREGKIHLLGQVPDQAISDEIVIKAAAVIGLPNVVNHFEIVPGIDFDRAFDAPIYVEDTVLFGVGSAELDPAYHGLIDLGVLLLALNPQATITVVTRTDSVGSAEANLELSRLRAQAIFDYYLSKGGNPAQGILDPRGEEGASDDDDPATRARQRSAEFILSGFLADPVSPPGP